MRIEIAERVCRPMGEVYAWCTDYSETDPGLSEVAIRQRRILSRSVDRVELEDDGVLGMSGAVHYVVQLCPPDRWTADATSRMGTGHNEYRLSTDGDGTRINVTFDLRPRGGYRLLGGFYRPFLRRRLSRLWRDLVRDMEEGR